MDTGTTAGVCLMAKRFLHRVIPAIYSNSNTILVTMIMEAATKKKHADLLREKILQPLNLQHTLYQPHDALPNSVAQGYYDLYNNKTMVNVSNLVTGSGNGYGGIYSNLFDLQKFINAVLVNKSFLQTGFTATNGNLW
jgi:D-alanyl-D-alanine carboxypeptidase